ncbi:MAG: hypothetical protein J6I49_03050 [Bacteroidales bacterium]|nr:hypothetical protein [Bacteroidales bacterium]
MRIKQAIGNRELWRREKTLFLTSKRAPIGCYEKVFRWVEEFDKWGCAVCFNTSEFEEEVLKALLVCNVPTTLVVLGKFNDTYNVQIERALKENRLLILVMQPEESDGKGFPARLRNQYVISQVQHIVCGYINPNGSIFGLLAGLNNVTWLLQKEDLRMAAEQPEKPYRWTVAEDKRLLRMFYEDMGIHAIHKAIDRPYSTIYDRIKSLTMSDELLKGREFEDYIVSLLDIPNNNDLTLKEWRGDKNLPGVYPENNSAPDLVFEYKDHTFAIECKWRSHMPKDMEKELLSADRLASFIQYSTKNGTTVYLLLGIGGLPNDPDVLLLAPLTKELTIETLNKGIVRSNNLLETITKLYPKSKSLRDTYPNHGAPWHKEDDQRLADLYKNSTTIPELMTIFGRSRHGITSRLKKLGLQ